MAPGLRPHRLFGIHLVDRMDARLPRSGKPHESVAGRTALYPGWTAHTDASRSPRKMARSDPLSPDLGHRSWAALAGSVLVFCRRMVCALSFEQGVSTRVQHPGILDAVPGGRSRKFRRRRAFELLDLARLAGGEGAAD